MLKVLVLICVVIALANAIPVQESGGPSEEEFQSGDQVAALDANDAGKKDLERSETFGFGYRYRYPRYYRYRSYHYPSYYSYYPRYYRQYPRYYYW